jgi:hypothetical protein
MTDRKIYIVEVAEQVNRKPATIRAWERSGMLPDELKPSRSDRGWRYWTQDQVDKMKQWIVDEDLRPGKGLKHYHPDAETLQGHLEGQRRPRKNREAREAAAADAAAAAAA